MAHARKGRGRYIHSIFYPFGFPLCFVMANSLSLFYFILFYFLLLTNFSFLVALFFFPSHFCTSDMVKQSKANKQKATIGAREYIKKKKSKE